MIGTQYGVLQLKVGGMQWYQKAAQTESNDACLEYMYVWILAIHF